MPHPKIYNVQYAEDASTGVFVTTGGDVPGLELQAQSILELRQAIRLAIPELVEANSGERPGQNFVVRLEPMPSFQS